LAPFYTQDGLRGGALGLRLPGGELGGRLAPLAASGQEQPVAHELARALASHAPHAGLVTFEDMPLSADWPAWLRERWPGSRRPATRRYQVTSSPTLSLREDSFEAWLGAKSSNFRREMRRLRRQFAAAEGSTRWSAPDTLAADIDTFVRLHHSRWQGRGSSFVRLGSRLGAVLDDLGGELITREGRFRMCMLEVAGQPISAQLFLASPSRVLYVNGGWDESYAKLKPSMLGILEVIEQAFQRGERRVDLGPGEQPYKLRFADGDDPLAWTILVPPGPGMPLRMARTVPPRAEATLRKALKTRLSERQLTRLRRLRAGAARGESDLQDTR